MENHAGTMHLTSARRVRSPASSRKVYEASLTHLRPYSAVGGADVNDLKTDADEVTK